MKLRWFARKLLARKSAKYPFAAMLAWLSCSTTLWAQAGPQSASEPDWVMSYTLVILSIGLGVFVVCRMGKRGQKVRQPRV